MGFASHAHTDSIQPKREHVVIPGRVQQRRNVRRSRRGTVKFADKVVFKYHPEDHIKRNETKQTLADDSWSRVHKKAQVARIGEFINLEILPAVLYITVRRSVQPAALRIIVTRIFEHIKNVPTRILLKRGKSGRYLYKQWLSAKELAKLSLEELYAKFEAATLKRKRGISVIVRQRIARGRLQKLWERKHSLL